MDHSEQLIDQCATDALFGGLDGDTVVVLLEAAEDDITIWCDKLLAAWAASDPEAASRARHSLRGLCGNFGAVALLNLSEQFPADQLAADRLRECRSATLAAMRSAVLS